MRRSIRINPWILFGTFKRAAWQGGQSTAWMVERGRLRIHISSWISGVATRNRSEYKRSPTRSFPRPSLVPGVNLPLYFDRITRTTSTQQEKGSSLGVHSSLSLQTPTCRVKWNRPPPSHKKSTQRCLRLFVLCNIPAFRIGPKVLKCPWQNKKKVKKRDRPSGTEWFVNLPLIQDMLLFSTFELDSSRQEPGSWMELILSMDNRNRIGGYQPACW